MDRRDLLRTMAAAAAATRLQGGTKPRPRPLPMVINGLGGLDDPNAAGAAGTDPWSPRVLRDLRASGLTGLNLTVGHVSGPGDPFELTVRDLARTNRLLRLHGEALLPVFSAADLHRARATRRTGIILGFQNTAMLGQDASRIDLFADLGVRVIQLTYNGENFAGDGSMAAGNRGLTPFGREVVARLDRTRTVLDLSHSGQRTCLEALEASARPALISHTGCRALSDLPRNKTDLELRRLADRGGVVGIYFMPYLKVDSFPDAGDAVRHLEHALQVCGEDHVALGTDGGTTGADDLEAVRRTTALEVADRKAAGIGAQGEKPGVLPFLPDLQGPGQFRKLAALLEARGHSAARIEKLLGGNLFRLLRDVWGD